jgi:hypothetical protein
MNIITRAQIRIGKSAFFLTTAVAVVGAIFLFPHWSNANAPGYKLAILERGPIISTVAAAGTINPITTIIVGSQLSGQIVEILADYNEISKGDRYLRGSIPIRSDSNAMLPGLISPRPTPRRPCRKQKPKKPILLLRDRQSSSQAV